MMRKHCLHCEELVPLDRHECNDSIIERIDPNMMFCSLGCAAAYGVRAAYARKFYHCTLCWHYHPASYASDCSSDGNRFTSGQLDELYGPDGWEEILR
jgi:hypothetical protein